MTTYNTARPTIGIWTGATASALIGAAFLFDAQAGINWPIWVASAAISVIAVRHLSRLPATIPPLILLGWSIVLAVAFALTTNGFIQLLIIASNLMLLGLAVLVTGTDSWRSLSAKLLPTVPFLAPIRVWMATLREVADVPRSTSSPRMRSVVRGLLITVPIVIVLVTLLRSADPVLGWITERVSSFIPEWSFSGRVLFFLFLLSITLGATAMSARQVTGRLPDLPPLSVHSSLGVTEQKMVLMSVAVILWLFMLLQLSYLVHPPPSAVGSGMTFAEYARRGFAELSIAVTLVGGIILLLEATRPMEIPARDERLILRLEAALLIALELMLVLAFRRVILYEQAYGFTSARLSAQAYMIVVAFSLIAVWLEVGRHGISIAFGRRVSVIALAVFTVFAFWHHDAWIMNRNIDRARTSGKFDTDYARRLSRDATPTLVARRAELPALQRQAVEAWIQCVPHPKRRRWFEWNRSVEAARLALETTGVGSCPTGRGATPPIVPAAPR
jgi:hypothetical protein